MLVRPPFCELREIVPHLLAVGVKDVRAVLVVEDSRLVRLVIGVAADVRPTVDQQDSRAMLRCETLGEDGAGKAGPDDQIVVAAARSGPVSLKLAHSAATSRAGDVDPVRVPSRSATRPAMRA